MEGGQVIVKTVKNKKLFFVIDMLNGFVRFGDLSDKRIAGIVPDMVDLLSCNKENDVMFVCDAHSEHDLEMKTYPEHCIAGSSEAQIIDELQEFVLDDESNVLYKNTTNGFWELDKNILNNYDEFIITGACTDICVMQFTLNLKTWLNKSKQDKQVVIYRNCVQTYESLEHDADLFHSMALSIMQKAGIIIKVWRKQ